MKSELIFSVVLVVSAAGGGYWLGQHHTQQSAAQISTETTAINQRTSLFLPPTTAMGKNQKAGQLSLAEIEAKILELKKSGRWVNYGFH
jgi:hypothetical protein